MGQLKKKAKHRRQEEEEKRVTRSRNWSELHPDLLRCIFGRLSFTSLKRSKLVCFSWYCASKGCVPNHIPWLVLFPSRIKTKKNTCMFFDPEDKEKVYRSRDLGLEFAWSYCVTTCGSWLLMNNVENLYILNPLTGERIDFDLPNTPDFTRACFWIDNKTKEYLVVTTRPVKFTKRGYNRWQKLYHSRRCEEAFYNDKNQKLYLRIDDNRLVDIWDFSGDIPSLDGSVSLPRFHSDIDKLSWDIDKLSWKMKDLRIRMFTTVSGEFLMVSCIKHRSQRIWLFHIYKRNEVDNKWVKIDSLGDEALIYDMGITVIANGSIPEIKRNSIYFTSISSYERDPLDIFVYDMTTQQVEYLPECVLSFIPSLSDARWFFPC